MTRYFFHPYALLIALSLLVPPVAFGQPAPSPAFNPHRVACIGDSITAGTLLPDASTQCYPAQLQHLLGPGWEVKNFGHSGTTLLNQGNRPYQQQKTFREALASNPGIVVIMLGTNDTKRENWNYKEEFLADYKDLIRQFKELPSKPLVYVCLPPPVVEKGNYGINENNLQEAIELIETAAKESDCAGVINVHEALEGKDTLYMDLVHPNPEGAALIAKTVYHALQSKDSGR